MEPDPTITITCDELLVFSDDANNPIPAEAGEVVVIPSSPRPMSAPPDPNTMPSPKPSPETST
jgi:hypothetical protein